MHKAILSKCYFIFTVESYTCGKCSKIFTSLSYLARHIKRVCPDMTHRKWKCDHCDKAFRHPFGLQQHVFTHTGERPHKCSQCPKAFYSSNDLRRHSRIHSGNGSILVFISNFSLYFRVLTYPISRHFSHPLNSGNSRVPISGHPLRAMSCYLQ